MNQGSKPSVSRDHFAGPLLLECDSSGRVLWVSQRAQEILGQPKSLSDLILVSRPEESGSARYRVYSWHFWRVWEFRNTVVIGLRPPQLPDKTHLEVLRIESRLLRSFLRLVRSERTLSRRAGAPRATKNSGCRVVRQIELERQRLGRELHTGVGQILAAIRLQLEIVGAELPLPPPAAMKALESISVLSADALEQVRTVSRRIHPPEWQRLTLEDAIRQLWQLSGVPDRFKGSLRIENLPRQPEPEIKAMIYRTFQEALSNIVRHSKASRIDVELKCEGNRIVLALADNGVGFDVEALRSAPASVSAGIGLRSIRELVAEVGGNFHMESSPLGTKLVVSVGISPE